MTSRIDGNDAVIPSEKRDLMLKVVVAFTVAMEQDERLALALFDIV